MLNVYGCSWDVSGNKLLFQFAMDIGMFFGIPTCILDCGNCFLCVVSLLVVVAK